MDQNPSKDLTFDEFCKETFSEEFLKQANQKYYRIGMPPEEVEGYDYIVCKIDGEPTKENIDRCMSNDEYYDEESDVCAKGYSDFKFWHIEEITEDEFNQNDPFKPKQPQTGDIVEYLFYDEKHMSWGKFEEIDEAGVIWVLVKSDMARDDGCVEIVDAWRWPGEKEWRR